MRKDIVNASFQTAINEKVPNKTKLVNLLVNILQIEKEAVYRRLRGEVPFTFAEVAVISEKLGVSLDQLIGIPTEKRRPFSLQLTDFFLPSETDYNMWENYLNILDFFQNDPSVGFYETWTTLPLPFIYKYKYLTQFYIFKWTFQAKNQTPTKRFDEIYLPERFVRLNHRHVNQRMNISSTELILDKKIFTSIVSDILFFHNVRMISKEEIKLVKTDLEETLNYLEELAVEGKFPETGKEISIYISDVDIDTNYSCVKSKGYYITMFRTLVLNAVATTDETTFEHVKNWFLSLKRFSTLISVSSEKQRVEFFNKQREIIRVL